MTVALIDLVAILRRRCPNGRWADATALAHEGAVSLERASDDELVFAIRHGDWPVPYTAVLYPEAEEWACDCGGSDPCAHVVAAVLAWESARNSGATLRHANATRAKVRYMLTGGDTLRCDRYLVHADGRCVALEGVVELRDTDVAVERALDAPPAQRTAALLAALAHCDDVFLDRMPVRVSTEVLVPRATVSDDGDGFLLTLDRPEGVVREVARAVALRGDVLHPIAVTRELGDCCTDLPRKTRIARSDVATLVLERLPRLREEFAVDVRTQRLPTVSRALRPRVVMNATLVTHLLTVTPSIVYGNPACARVEAGRLVYLRGELPRRDREAEVALAHQVRDVLDLVIGVRAEFRGDEVARFLSKLKRWGEGYDEAASLVDARELSPKFSAHDDGFELSFTLDGAGDEAPRSAEAEAVIAAWREGLDVVPLLDGTWASLPASWLREHGHRVADLLASRRDDGTVARAALPSLAAFCEALEQPPPPRLARLRALVDGTTELPDIAPPGDLRATLRPYQQRGVSWLSLLRDAEIGAVLADDMGLGKTLQTLAVFRGRTLVVAPRSVIENWVNELHRFRPSLTVSCYHGPERTLDAQIDVTVTTYAVLRLDASTLAAVHWDVVVLDEAQAIKNPDSQTARAAYALKGTFRVALSGTPVENRLEELWSIAHFTNPGLLGGRGDFEARYGAPIARGDKEAAARLRRRVGPFVLRRRKRDVAPELPPRSEVVLRVELDEQERAVYDAVRAAMRDDVARALRAGAVSLEVLEALLRLRQAACHAALLPGQHASRSSKVDCLVEALTTTSSEGHRALVFSQWTSLLDLVEPHLREAGLTFSRLDGATRERASVVAAFQRDDGPAVMLVSLKAGGTGINLTAADHVFMLDPWWNPAVEDQAADRTHRIGQTRPVTVYRLVAEGTIETRILELQQTKRSLAEAAIDGNDPEGSLTRDDLLALLGDT